MKQTPRLVMLLTAFLAAMSPSCGASTPADSEPVLVFAAASLTDAFAAVATSFEANRPEFDVELNFAASSSLRQQILEGAPADVFASANTSNMDQVIEAGEASTSTTLATNVLQIAVPAGNPAGVTGLSDFARDDLLIGLCAEGVPCGDLSRQALGKAGVVAAVDTNEPDVRALLVKIEAGELDAGIVYATDVAATGDRVEGVDIPADFNVVAIYPIAVLANAPNAGGAHAFVTFAVSDQARAVLSRYGFSLP
jgi:molybdate transport system substrate-binding protein